MANIGGPKGPSDPTRAPGGGAKILPFPKPADKGLGQGETSLDTSRGDKTQADATQIDKSEAKPGLKTEQRPPVVVRRELQLDLPEKKGNSTALIDPNGGRDAFVPPHGGEGQQRGAGVRARLAALGVKGHDALPIKTAGKDGVRLRDTPLGKILDGSVTIESPKGLEKLEGVVRITGDLVLQESVARSPDLLALRTLIEIGGRLTIEGNASLGAIDALQNLERAKGMYIGFNAALHKVVFPKLKELDAALILEGNPALTEIQLPAFTRGGLYLHIHDNAALTTVTIPSLLTLGDELSLIDNPHLQTVKIASKDKPAEVGLVELKGNGAESFPHLYVRIAG